MHSHSIYTRYPYETFVRASEASAVALLGLLEDSPDKCYNIMFLSCPVARLIGRNFFTVPHEIRRKSCALMYS